MGCLLDQVLGAGLRREAVTEFGVRQPDEGESAFGGGLALEVGRPEFGHDPMGVDPRRGVRSVSRATIVDTLPFAAVECAAINDLPPRES